MLTLPPKFRPIGTRPDFVVPIFAHDLFDKRISPSSRKEDDGLPDNLTWFGAQIAGHKTQIKDGKQQLGFIKDLELPERLLKPVMKDKRGQIEKNFYETVFSSARLIYFRSLLPFFYGIREISYKGTKHEALEMEDISECFVIPAIVDIKVGKRTFGPDATAEKMRKEIDKYPQQEEIGFRILGYKVESAGSIKVASRDREYCLTLKTEDIEDLLREFLSIRGADDVHIIIDQLLKQLSMVRKAAAKGVYHIFSSSLLIAYEADRSASPRAEIRWIDFSHVFPGNGEPDENFLYGIDRLIDHLRTLRSVFI